MRLVNTVTHNSHPKSQDRILVKKPLNNQRVDDLKETSQKKKKSPPPNPHFEPKTQAAADVSIFDALPGFGSFVPELPTAESLVPELPDLGVGAAMAAAFAEDTTVKAQAIPTPKKIKAPP